MRWGCRTRQGPVSRGEHFGHPSLGTAALAHLHQRAHEVAHHVLEEGGALHDEGHGISRSALHAQPAHFPHGVRRLAVRGPEGGVVVPPEQGGGRTRHGLHLEGGIDFPVGVAAQRRAGRQVAHPVAVALPPRPAPGIERRGHLLGPDHRDVLGQQAVEPPVVGLERQLTLRVEAHHLSRGVDPRVGPPRGHHFHVPSEQPAQRFAQLRLDGAAVALHLPPHVAGAVVFDRQFQARHRQRLQASWATPFPKEANGIRVERFALLAQQRECLPSGGGARQAAPWPRLEASPDRFQVAVEVRVRADHEGGVGAHRLAVGLQGLEKAVELGILAVGLAIDVGHLSIGFPSDLLGLARGLRANDLELSLHLPENFLAAASAFGAEFLSDALALGDHPVLHLLPDAGNVVDSLDADVQQLDAVVGNLSLGGLQDLSLQFLAPAIRGERQVHVGLEGSPLFERMRRGPPVGGPNDLFEPGAGNLVAHDGVEDVVEAVLRAALIVHALQEQAWVRDPQAGAGADQDELPAERWNLLDITLPDQQALVEAADLIDERPLPVKPGLGDRLALDLSKLDDEGLLGLAHAEGRGINSDQNKAKEDANAGHLGFHFWAPPCSFK
ncbi:hypothetical protein STIAU_1009 [Stigmatella aurantiaca DW4/3-1]|uniref:Uncharacterized protein n=1 Tax=Stigmatella aurantiaca (strain DW4/3-1) TaxID=378806 RepID=Q092Z3_STIAD|nr:hypothetical protein STIAU_1009 [Stigmatella aurantiaca DW4/3-1]